MDEIYRRIQEEKVSSQLSTPSHRRASRGRSCDDQDYTPGPFHSEQHKRRDNSDTRTAQSTIAHLELGKVNGASSDNQGEGSRLKSSHRSRTSQHLAEDDIYRPKINPTHPEKSNGRGARCLFDKNNGARPKTDHRSNLSHGYNKGEQNHPRMSTSERTGTDKHHKGTLSSSVDEGRAQSSLRFRSEHSMNRMGRAEHEDKPLTKFQMMEMLKADPEDIILRITSSRSGLKVLLDSKTMDDITLGVMLELICKALMAHTPQSVHLLLQLINDSKLLPGPITRLVCRGTSESLSDKTLENILVLMKSVLQCFPTSALPNITVIQSHLVQIRVKFEENNCLKKLLEDLDQVKACILEQVKEEQIAINSTNKATREDRSKPPDDFRKISVVPTTKDIYLDDEPFLRRNRVKGGYQSAEDYLDIQFRLLREDFVRPLRDGINEFRRLKTAGLKNIKYTQDIRVYKNVQVGIPICSSFGIVYEVRFDVSHLKKVKWESSKRLIYGSLVCLSVDNFETLVLGTVAERDPTQLRKGFIFIAFESTSFHLLNPNPSTVYEMVECSAYFEAYRHNLEGLQEMTSESLPFKKYILNTEVEKVSCPRYLQGRGVEYDLSCLCKEKHMERYPSRHNLDGRTFVPILDTSKWPSAEEMGLDDSQYQALQTGLTKEFAVIQGPPGTGKTFLGLKIMQVLLMNKTEWNPRPGAPILVVCYTNHALDQFLEGILTLGELEPGKLIRIGGRSNSDWLDKYKLSQVKRDRETRVRLEDHIKEDINRCADLLENVKQAIEKLTYQVQFSQTNIIHEMYLQHVIPPDHLKSLLTKRFGSDCVVFPWLLMMDGPTIGQANVEEIEEQEEEIDNFDEEDVQSMEAERKTEGEEKISSKFEKLQSRVNDLQEGSVYGKGTQGTGGEESWTKVAKKKDKKLKQNLSFKTFDAMSENEASSVTNVWKLNETDRWRLYRYWVSLYGMESFVRLQQYCQEYQVCTSRLKELRSQEDFQILTIATVIGMTTTGAAKYRSIIQRVQPRIIIVEEAAEVLEAHIVTTLTQNCQHLILIGDHQQLRPNPTVYKLAKEYNMDISLFERMVKNNMQCDKLLIQHRMRPEIVKLIVPHVYKVLHNHSSVLEYDNVMGVAGNVFFITHQETEMAIDDTRSHSNKHEAEYLVAFCRYLLQQGYDASQITILVMYTGQMFLVKKKFYDDKTIKELIGDTKVRITPVDNYQGEENDIILLSLVRSNAEGRIGFLSIQNRVCVALSRAKKGFFAVGNLTLLEEASSLWKNIAEDLRGEGRVVDGLPLACQNHPETKIHAVRSEDFNKAPKGGCMKPCDYRLPCGHVCVFKCHPTDPMHEEYECRKPCLKELCDRKHKCPRLCYEKCLECRIPVEKIIPKCGDTQMVPCHMGPETFTCKMPCRKVLSCGHQCQSICGKDCDQDCNVIVPDREWPCGDILSVECSKTPNNFKCPVKKERKLDCGHTVKALCSDSLENIVCVKLVTVLMCPKEHKRQVPCNKAEETKLKPCTEQITQKCAHDDKHEYIVKCFEVMDKPCPLKCASELPCGHLCTGKCSDCHEFNDHPECKAPCKLMLICGHRCQGTCGEPCPPCRQHCTKHCGHQPCRNQCGQKCWQCRQQCSWRCRHHSCDLLCWEVCLRPPCNKPCPLRLRCGHPCVGLCGEICPAACRICNAAYFNLVEQQSGVQLKASTRFVMLHPCNHIVDVGRMDAIMRKEPQRGGANAVVIAPYCCPVCSSAIQTCPRYNALLKALAQDFEKVKLILNELQVKSNIMKQAIQGMKPHEARSMRFLLRDETKSDSGSHEDMRGRLAVIGMVEECKEMFSTMERRIKNANGRNNLLDGLKIQEDLEILKTMLHPISEALTKDNDEVKNILPNIIILYLLCHVKLTLTYIRNPRIRAHLVETSRILEREKRQLEMVDLKNSRGIQAVMSAVNRTMVNNLNDHQRNGIKDYNIKIKEFFTIKLDHVKNKVWLKCEKGHVFFGDRQRPVEDRLCPKCNVLEIEPSTWLDKHFEEDAKVERDCLDDPLEAHETLFQMLGGFGRERGVRRGGRLYP